MQAACIIFDIKQEIAVKNIQPYIVNLMHKKVSFWLPFLLQFIMEMANTDDDKRTWNAMFHISWMNHDMITQFP